MNAPTAAEAGVTSVCIATPSYDGSCKMGYVESLLGLALALRDRGIGLDYVTIRFAGVAEARNHAARYFLERTQASHLFFVDADMRWRAEDALAMFAHGGRDVLAALCVRKEYDWAKIAAAARGRADLDPETLPLVGARPVVEGLRHALEPVEAARAGAGLMLVRREIFLRLAARHPERLVRSGREAGLQRFFSVEREVDGEPVGEDVAFCADVRAAGGRVYLCPWFRTGHIGEHEFVGDPSYFCAGSLG